MKSKIFPILIILFLIGSSISTYAIIIPPSTKNFMTTGIKNTVSLNKTTFRFATARIIVPLESNLEIINDGFHTSTGFGGKINMDFGYSLIGFIKMKVIDGPVKIKPLSSNSIDLQPGDNISVLFGVFLYCYLYPVNYPDRGLMIGRLIGVTIEQFD